MPRCWPLNKTFAGRKQQKRQQTHTHSPMRLRRCVVESCIKLYCHLVLVVVVVVVVVVVLWWQSYLRVKFVQMLDELTAVGV